MSTSARPLLVGLCLLVACRPGPNGGGGGGDDTPPGDGGKPTDACPCNDGGGGGSDGGSAACAGASANAAQPFGNHARPYASGTILPSHSQQDLDDAVRDFYDHWKSDYLKAGCGSGRYYVLSGGGHQSVSEGHGYGMLVMALMAGHDPQAKTIFDGLVNYYLDHPSEIEPTLMSWAQGTSCQNVEGVNSATDGDLDIAYALLLADKQWSSGGAIDYRDLADKIINGIRKGEVDGGATYVQLGDWAHDGSTFGRATRSSDFMPAHFESFAAVTGDASWRQIRDRSYGIMTTLQTQFAAQTGLLPDFIADAATSPHPVNGGFLEGANDGQYAYNACRDPWRIASDFVLNGDSRSKTIVQKMTTWLRQRTGNNPNSILPGYNLGGNSTGGNYLDLAFVAPFGVAAMVDAGNQSWLDSIWDTTVAHYGDGYYQDTVALLSLVTMSGNWWAPEAAPCP